MNNNNKKRHILKQCEFSVLLYVFFCGADCSLELKLLINPISMCFQLHISVQFFFSRLMNNRHLNILLLHKQTLLQDIKWIEAELMFCQHGQSTFLYCVFLQKYASSGVDFIELKLYCIFQKSQYDPVMRPIVSNEYSFMHFYYIHFSQQHSLICAQKYTMLHLFLHRHIMLIVIFIAMDI